HINSKKVPIYAATDSIDIMDEQVDQQRAVERYVWREVGPDHFFHAGTYEMLARIGYHGGGVLPSVGLRSIDRAQTMKDNAKSAVARPTMTGSLLPTSLRRARRRYN